MELYRISQEKFAEDLSGNGSRLFGGRWNSEGYYALYTSFTRSLALLETLAHTPAKMLDIKDYQLITLFVPDDAGIEKIKLSSLPKFWDAPDTRSFTKKLGDKFLSERLKLLLEVPCVMMPEEVNFVINPLHKDMHKVKIVHSRRIYFDKRVEGNL
ncbi:MAG: RES family NAD+ phosphorylase [Ginsengibacter sp.]